MSFKALVQLFAEKFLTSKKEWVGHQAMPSRRVQLDATITRYVAPSDGWIGVYANSNPFFDVLVTSGGLVVARFSATQEAGATCRTSCTLPIAKGQRLELIVVTGVSEIWFAPANGSATT